MEQFGDLETGGVLIGYWSGHDAVVTVLTGAGPRATHRHSTFSPDHEYQVQFIKRVYAASGRQHTYLGDWHSHPKGPGVPSRRDLATLRSISTFAAARAPRPLMMIVSREDWDVSIYVGPAATKSPHVLFDD